MKEQIARKNKTQTNLRGGNKQVSFDNRRGEVWAEGYG